MQKQALDTAWPIGLPPLTVQPLNQPLPCLLLIALMLLPFQTNTLVNCDYFWPYSAQDTCTTCTVHTVPADRDHEVCTGVEVYRCTVHTVPSDRDREVCTGVLVYRCTVHTVPAD